MKLSERREGIVGGGVSAPFILNLGNRWHWVVSFKPQPLPSHYPLNRELDGSQTWSKGHIFECSIDCVLSQYVECEVSLCFLQLMNLAWLKLNLKPVALNAKQAHKAVRLDPRVRAVGSQRHTPAALPLGKTLVTPRTRGCLCVGDDLDWCGKPLFHRSLNPGSPSRSKSLYRLHSLELNFKINIIFRKT